jgi:hypothetical protein
MEYGYTARYCHHVSNNSLTTVLNAVDLPSTLLIKPRHHIMTFSAIAINLKEKNGVSTCHVMLFDIQ